MALDRTSVPWACDDYTVIAPDGTPLKITRAAPREGWILIGPPGLPREEAPSDTTDGSE